MYFIGDLTGTLSDALFPFPNRVVIAEALLLRNAVAVFFFLFHKYVFIDMSSFSFFFFSFLVFLSAAILAVLSF